MDWKDLKEIYKKEQTNLIKVPKLAEDYNDENKANSFENVDCYEFEFVQFDKEQLLEIFMTVEENKSDKVKKQMSLILGNIRNWKNVKVTDIFGESTQLTESQLKEDLKFNKEAFDALLVANFHLVPFIINSINEELTIKKEKQEAQKKT